MIQIRRPRSPFTVTSSAQSRPLTRPQPWPIIERFLTSLPDGAIGLDVGCGNGKYLAVNPRVFIVGSDRSTNLVTIARKHAPHAAVVADALQLPHPVGRFDFAISIAVIHHLSTSERRVEAVRAVLETLKSGEDEEGVAGKALIYVWALEQKESRRGWDEGDAQDVMVPWVMRARQNKAVQQRDGGAEAETEQDGNKDKTFHRYYHLYRKGELEHDIAAAGGEVIEAGYEKDNWWAIARRKPGA